MRVPAEFVIFLIDVETATRSEDERARELERAYAAIVERVRRTPGLTIEAGDAYDSVPLETVAVREIIQPDDDDPMRSEIKLVLTASLQPGDRFETVRGRVEQLLSGVSLPGRVEVMVDPDQFIGVDDPRKHREALLRQIAADTDLLQSLFGRGQTGPASISLTGLERRVRSRAVAPLELEVYVEYEMSLVQAPRN